MIISKQRIGKILYDVIDYEDFFQLSPSDVEMYINMIPGVAIHYKGYTYPLYIYNNTILPGVCITGCVMTFQLPPDPETFSDKYLVDYHNIENYKELVMAQSIINESELAILTTPDNITIPKIQEEDTPAMVCLKTAIINKYIDLDKYSQRFGSASNFNNDKRLLSKNSITLDKILEYADALDLSVELNITDKNPNVPNPMGCTVSAILTNEENVGLGVDDDGLF